MAELHVQPKKNNSWWIWLLLAIIIIGGAIYYYVNYYQKGKTIGGSTNTDTTYNSNTTTNTDTSSMALGQANLWDQIDFNSPDTTYPEVSDKNITTQSNAHFVIYSLNTQSLFVGNNSDLSNEGKQRLDQVATSINNRFSTSDVKIFDNSDTTNASQLSEQRAQAVSNYLVNNAKLDQSRVSIYQQGQGTSVPAKSNRVNIVVKR